jgi:hypothetical protein
LGLKFFIPATQPSRPKNRAATLGFEAKPRWGLKAFAKQGLARSMTVVYSSALTFETKPF